LKRKAKRSKAKYVNLFPEKASGPRFGFDLFSLLSFIRVCDIIQKLFHLGNLISSVKVSGDKDE